MSKKHTAVVDAATRLSPQARDKLREAILEMEGREVFAIGALDASGIVQSLDIVARGTEHTVAAPFRYRESAQVLIHNHPSGTLLPSEADIAVAAEAGAEGIGSYIVDNDVSQVLVVAEPARLKTLRPLGADEIAAVLDTGGKLSRVMPGFETRPSQVDMAHDVSEIISDGGILVAEAGTGVGKSFAYLIPALAWAIGNNERVVISTATINLQQQIFKKDFPTVSTLFKNLQRPPWSKDEGTISANAGSMRRSRKTRCFRIRLSNYDRFWNGTTMGEVATKPTSHLPTTIRYGAAYAPRVTFVSLHTVRTTTNATFSALDSRRRARRSSS